MPHHLLYLILLFIISLFLVEEKSKKLVNTMKALRQKVKKVRTGELLDSDQNISSSHEEDWSELCHQESKKNYYCLWASAAEVIYIFISLIMRIVLR